MKLEPQASGPRAHVGSFYPLGKLGSFGLGHSWSRGVRVSAGSLDRSFFHFCLRPIPALSLKRWKFELCMHKLEGSLLEKSLQAGRTGRSPLQEATSISRGQLKPAKARGLYLFLTSTYFKEREQKERDAIRSGRHQVGTLALPV